jgi:uncharacterized repeat protein (TIGR03803 family)
MALSLSAQTFKRVHSFNGTDGQNPNGVVQGTDGGLYVASPQGGVGYGTIFKLSASGKATTLFTFCSVGTCTGGAYPIGPLVQAIDGNLYGVTNGGGIAGFGSVFKITSSGALTKLYDFCSSGYPVCPDGYGPYAGLIQASDGNFYGTAEVGGASGCGTIFKITAKGKLTTLHSFNDTDGCFPHTPLVQASDGNFYGTTSEGGTVYKITPSGQFTTLHTFCTTSGCPDGINPGAGLIQAADGNLYGTTAGALGSIWGTVFRITLRGTLTTLHTFCSMTNCADGAYPGPLVEGTDGNIYGVTDGPAVGTTFQMDPNGTLTTLYTFCPSRGCLDGEFPGALILNTSGTFYGTASSGGGPSCSGFGCGTMFSLATGLGPFVKTLLPSGKVGAAITILGTNLTGATSVTFNGAPGAFTVSSKSAIKATVPAGATTGTIQVVTPSGTLSSNVPFQITP